MKAPVMDSLVSKLRKRGTSGPSLVTNNFPMRWVIQRSIQKTQP
jgi:hypothetical protein